MTDNRGVELIAELGPGPREVSRARRALARALEGWGWRGESADVAILLASELLTNAVRHAGAPVRLSAGVEPLGGLLRVEVHDEVVEGVSVRRASGDDEDGRGLQLVDVLAHQWGWRAVATGGKRVWFELDRGHA